MTTQFTCFPRLPAELRLAIWKLCLPQRVIELDSPNNLGFDTPCELQHTSHLNLRPPVITHVCHEARQVALENGRAVADDTDANNDGRLPFWSDSNALGHTWWNPGNAVVHLNWFLPSKYHTRPPLPFFLRKAAQAGGGASIVSNLVHDFDDDIEKVRPSEEVLCLLEKGRKSYMVCLKMISLHVTDEEAARSGLFGRLVEERVQLVDPFDEETIRKFHNLWSHGPPEDAAPAEFFDLALSKKERFHDRIKQWGDNVEKVWVATKWLQLKRRSANAGKSDEIWLNIGEEGGGSPSTMFINLWRFNISQCAPNKDHPWVKSVLDSIPEFRPMIMFRLCRQECYPPNLPKGARAQLEIAERAFHRDCASARWRNHSEG
jgi:hypothetical protein